MRIDKYLKVSRLVKRRTLAKELCDNGRVAVNDKVIKSSYSVKLEDVIEITFGNRTNKVKVLQILDHAKKEDTVYMYEVLSTN